MGHAPEHEFTDLYTTLHLERFKHGNSTPGIDENMKLSKCAA